MDLALILFPLAMALAAFAVPSNARRPWLLPFAGFIHLALTLWTLTQPAVPVLAAPWLALDPLGRLVLLLVSLLFFVVSFYLVSFLRLRGDRPNRVFCACILACQSTLTLVTWSNHLGLMWVGIETTALATASLIYFHHNPRSIEAAWKYLLIGSVGIALSLLGSFFLAYSSLHSGTHTSLLYTDLLSGASHLSKPWLHAAFVLMLVGYGTKMGLAPMHTWKPDAYGEAPAAVGALLAGGVTSAAFLCILRIYHLCAAAGETAFVAPLLVFMGLLSMIVAGIFMVGQQDYKRMLAYSSVEHMGILVLGIGIGGPALFGALLHMVNNGLAKCVMFLSAGNIHRSFASTSTDVVRGAMRRIPWSASLFLAGFLAVTGSPPFGPFISEFTILNAAFSSGRYLVGALFLLFLLIVFIGMGATVLNVVQGKPSREAPRTPFRENALLLAPPILCISLVLLLGLHIPAPLLALLNNAARFLETAP